MNAYLREMKIKLAYFFAFALSIALLAGGCQNSAERYRAEITGIDSMLVVLDSAALVFAQIKADTVQAAALRMKEDLRNVQMQAGEEISVEVGQLLGDYTRALRLVKDFPQRMRTLPIELDRTRHQLNGLKHALTSGATTDQAGNKINPDYVSQQYSMEMKLADGLAQELINTASYADRSLVMYKELEPRVRAQFEAWSATE